jgi:hypothetical protein
MILSFFLIKLITLEIKLAKMYTTTIGMKHFCEFVVAYK